MSNNEKLSANIEEYLETIYKISQNEKIVKTSRISKDLGITSASVSEMLKKLDKMDYVNYFQYKGVKLTENGLKVAKRITRKHRLLERFLRDILKLKDHILHDQACEWNTLCLMKLKEHCARF